jgi:hypothetical protein
MVKSINNLEELLNMERTGKYILLQDIDCDGAVVPCVAGDFSGMLDGNGHKISNLVLGDRIWGDEQSLALFCSTSNATIKNITFENLALRYEPNCYSPRVAALVVNCYKTVVEGVAVTATNSVAQDTPLIYDCNNCTLSNNTMMCNGKPSALIKYE